MTKERKKKPKALDVVDAIQRGLYSREELRSIDDHLHAARERIRPVAGARDLESHRVVLDTLIQDAWDEGAEAAFVGSLLALVHDRRSKDDDVRATIGTITSAAAAAFDLRSELEGMSDEDEYFDYAEEFDRRRREAHVRLQRFWDRHVKRGPTKRDRPPLP